MAILEIKEVLRHWLRGRAKRLIARRLGLDVKTVRKYVRVAEEHGLTPGPETAVKCKRTASPSQTILRRQMSRMSRNRTKMVQ
jgi:transposase-like protein